MVGIKNVLPLFCVNNCVLQGLDLVISTEHAPNLKQLTWLIADYSGLTATLPLAKFRLRIIKLYFLVIYWSIKLIVSTRFEALS